MEFALPELLSREDILKILKQRQLHIHNINQLTHDEILRVYKTFVMPLTKRPERSKKLKQIYNVSTSKNGEYEDHDMQVEHFDDNVNSMDIDFTCVEDCNLEQLRPSIRIGSPVGEKRRQQDFDEDILHTFEDEYLYQISSVTKRIRINSLT